MSPAEWFAAAGTDFRSLGQQLAAAGPSFGAAARSGDTSVVKDMSRQMADTIDRILIELDHAGPPPHAIEIDGRALLSALARLQADARTFASCVNTSDCAQATASLNTDTRSLLDILGRLAVATTGTSLPTTTTTEPSVDKVTWWRDSGLPTASHLYDVLGAVGIDLHDPNSDETDCNLLVSWTDKARGLGPLPSDPRVVDVWHRLVAKADRTYDACKARSRSLTDADRKAASDDSFDGTVHLLSEMTAAVTAP